VFDSAEHGGEFALELAARFKQYSASVRGLPGDLSVRVALHCGPVLVGPDPVVRAIAFNGSHVSRAARIEPVVEPGSIFVSEEFAAAATIEAPEAFAFESLGNVTLAKDSGICHLYSLKRPTHT
jgi:adenylate cyclase